MQTLAEIEIIPSRKCNFYSSGRFPVEIEPSVPRPERSALAFARGVTDCRRETERSPAVGNIRLPENTFYSPCKTPPKSTEIADESIGRYGIIQPVRDGEFASVLDDETPKICYRILDNEEHRVQPIPRVRKRKALYSEFALRIA